MLQSDESFSVAEFVCTLLESDESDIYRLVHNEIDRILLSEVLDYVEGNQTLASQRLGISRSTLYNRISGLGLSFEKRVRRNLVTATRNQTATNRVHDDVNACFSQHWTAPFRQNESRKSPAHSCKFFSKMFELKGRVES